MGNNKQRQHQQQKPNRITAKREENKERAEAINKINHVKAEIWQYMNTLPYPTLPDLHSSFKLSTYTLTSTKLFRNIRM